jgi:F0F1-type ATP synthase membrane subunit a
MLYLDPLEQFSIEIYTNCFGVFGVLPTTTITFMLFFNLLLVFFSIYSFKKCFLLNKYQKLVEGLFNLVSSVLKDSVLVQKYFFVVLLYVVFLFMLEIINVVR